MAHPFPGGLRLQQGGAQKEERQQHGQKAEESSPQPALSGGTALQGGDQLLLFCKQGPQDVISRDMEARLLQQAPKISSPTANCLPVLQ
jgi:hypothetical protein